MRVRAWLWMACVGAALAAPAVVYGQWEMEQSGVVESLRGVSSVGGRVAWASGTHGTVLRTVDGGHIWQRCAMPQGLEGKEFGELDFRGVVGLDAKTAIVMSSGKGALSRVYKTTDGCGSWKLLAANPDAEGFWDALAVGDEENLWILGDPVGGRFVVRLSRDGGARWVNEDVDAAAKGEGAFAASNSSLMVNLMDGPAVFGTGGPEGARLFTQCDSCKDPHWSARPMPMFAKGESAGIFSIDFADWVHLVAVGGDYKKPNDAVGNAAWSRDGGKSWHAAAQGPHGYRSAVQYDEKAKVWIAVGPSGTDLSRDCGRNWIAVQAGADAGGQWNALSLPFVVGPKGRIGKWRGDAVASHAK